MGHLYVNTALNLLLVLILMLTLMFFLKKFKMTKFAKSNPIKIINTVALGSKEKVLLVEVNNTTLLLGATPSHIETLYVFGEAENLPNNKLAELKKSEPSYEQIAALTQKGI